MKIGEVKEVKVDIYNCLSIEIDDKEAIITPFNKFNLMYDYGVVFLGIDFMDDYKTTIEEVNKDGTNLIELPGFTNRPEIVAIVDKWLKKSDSNLR